LEDIAVEDIVVEGVAEQDAEEVEKVGKAVVACIVDTVGEAVVEVAVEGIVEAVVVVVEVEECRSVMGWLSDTVEVKEAKLAFAKPS
jgi:hypothetical protein